MPFTGKAFIDETPCPKCGSEVEVMEWESSDEAFTDYRYACTSRGCDYKRWVDGPDA